MAQNSGRLPITWPGSLFYLLSAALFLMLLRNMNRRKKMNTINETGLQVYGLLTDNGFDIPQAKIITAQAAHETGNFTSKIFKENNNLFGMKLPKVRKTFATGEKYGHATFDNLADSVKDFKIYYKNFKYLPVYNTINSYVLALVKRNYFEAKAEEYEKGVNYFYNLYFGV